MDATKVSRARWLSMWLASGIVGWFIGTFLMSEFLSSGVGPSLKWFLGFMAGWTLGGIIEYERRVKHADRGGGTAS